MSQAATKQWDVNLHRATNSGRADTLDWPVQAVWANDQTIYHSEPRVGQYTSGRRREGRALYPTEDAAWDALAEQFERWVDVKRAAIARRGKPEQPVRKRKAVRRDT